VRSSSNLLERHKTHGATHALDLSFNVLTFPGCNVVLPTPGFPAYKTLLGTLGCEIRYYTCRADRGWECDLEEMEREVDENTAFILVVRSRTTRFTSFFFRGIPI
jgi:tyrosine aminotransferase